MEEGKKPAKKMQQKLVDSAGAAGESASAGGNQTANRLVEKNVPASKIQSKRKDVGGTSASSKRMDRVVHNEIDRSLLKVDETTKIGSGTFGNCYLAVYRNDFTVVVKEITSRMTNSPPTGQRGSPTRSSSNHGQWRPLGNPAPLWRVYEASTILFGTAVSCFTQPKCNPFKAASQGPRSIFAIGGAK